MVTELLTGVLSSHRVLKVLSGCLFLIILMTMPENSNARENELAVNFVEISEKLHTSGQPDSEVLSSLADRGYEMVINLAPPTSRGSIATEGKLIADTGITYVNIPVDWRNPEYADFELFSGIMKQSGGRKVLVHCQMNMRVSMFTFLYRVVYENIPPEQAYEFVKKVWEPRDQWTAFGKQVLQKHNIDFEFPEK